MESVLQFLQSTPVLVALGTLLLTVFARTIIKIFRMGVTFKTELVTKEEQIRFEESIRKDLRSYKDELQRTILETCLRTIDRELSNVYELKNIAQETKTQFEVQSIKMKEMENKYEKIEVVGDTLRNVVSRLDRIEFGDTTTRRSE